jgi:DNA-binding GntR family transcriptional regulator
LHLVNRIVFGKFNSEGKRPTQSSKADRDENRRKVLASHDEIYTAIARGDAPAAKAAMERHIQDIIDKSLSAIVRSGSRTRELTDEELIYNG